MVLDAVLDGMSFPAAEIKLAVSDRVDFYSREAKMKSKGKGKGGQIAAKEAPPLSIPAWCYACACVRLG